MKQLLFIIALSLTMFTVQAQSQVKQDSTGNYYSVTKTKEPARSTGKTFTDSKGVVYPVMQSASGKLYVIRTSKKTGKTYKQYLKL